MGGRPKDGDVDRGRDAAAERAKYFLFSRYSARQRESFVLIFFFFYINKYKYTRTRIRAGASVCIHAERKRDRRLRPE